MIGTHAPITDRQNVKEGSCIAFFFFSGARYSRREDLEVSRSRRNVSEVQVTPYGLRYLIASGVSGRSKIARENEFSNRARTNFRIARSNFRVARDERDDVYIHTSMRRDFAIVVMCART